MRQTGKGKGKPITANQCRKIHAMKSAMGMADEDYRAMLRGMFGGESSTHLSFQAAGQLIEEMEAKAVGMGVWTHKGGAVQRFNELADRKGSMATPAQLRKIEAVWEEVSRINDPDLRAKALRNFVERTAKVSALRFLDKGRATKVLNGLKAMQEPLNGPRPGKKLISS